VDLFGGADLARQRQKQKREKALKWRSEGLSYRKIGDKLGISLQAAAQLIKRAGG
jgi:DNA-binding CsgD family transcriptional regulator